jgi:HSP20 family molecular chaperone IbpA
MPRQLAVGASRLTRVRPASAEPQTEGAIMPKFLQKKEAADPLAFMRRITQELDRAFGLRGDVARLPEMAPLMWTPEIEVFERDEEFIVRVDLPGLKKEDVKIEVTHDELTIEGERKLEKETREGGVHQTERAYGKFYRPSGFPNTSRRRMPSRRSRTVCSRSRCRQFRFPRRRNAPSRSPADA